MTFRLLTLLVAVLPGLAQTYTIQAVAGSDVPMEGPGLTVPIYPVDITAGPNGSFFVSDSSSRRIVKLAPDFTVTSIAGPVPGSPSGDQCHHCNRRGSIFSAQFLACLQPTRKYQLPTGFEWVPW